MQTRSRHEAVGATAPTPPSPERGREGRYLFAGITVASIWVAVALASIWSPDMITGSQHEHLAIAALADWLYAAIASGLVLMAFSRRTPGASRSLWLGFTVAVASIWLVVALASIYAPSMVTGTDPTTIPVAAFAAPIAGVLATAFACVFAAGSQGRDTGSEV
jgi:hypothetical protein